MRKLVVGLLLLSVIGQALLLQPRAVHAQQTSNDVVVQTIPGPTVAEKLGSRFKSSWPWYVTRASGLIAAFTLVVLILSGVGQVTGYTFKFLDPLTSWASHRALGIAFGVSVLVHIFSLLFDHFVTFTIWDVLIPWHSGYAPLTLWGVHLGSFYVALGVLAFYLTALVVITSLLWVEKKPYTWKLLHLLSYFIIFFVFIHALFIGTDLLHGVWRWLWIALGASIVWGVGHRLWRAYTI